LRDARAVAGNIGTLASLALAFTLSPAFAQSRTAEEMLGASWSRLTSSPDAADVQSVFFVASGRRTLLYGRNGGIWYLDTGTTAWKPAQLNGTEYFGYPAQLVQDPVNPERVVAATLTGPNPHDGPFESLDSGATWRAIARPSGYANLRSFRGLSINPSNADDMVGRAGLQIDRTLDGGKSWRTSLACGAAAPPCGLAGPNAIVHRDPFNAGVLLTPQVRSTIGNTTYPTAIVRSTDGGATWSVVPLATESASESLDDGKCVGFSPSERGLAYACTRDSVGGTVRFYRSTDSGATWARVSSLAAGSSARMPLWIDPRNPRHLLLAAGALYRSTDGGATWSDTGILEGVTDIATDGDYARGSDRIFLVAQGLKVIDGIDTWRNRGLQTVGTGLAGIEAFNTVSVERGTGNVLFASITGTDDYYDFSTRLWSRRCGPSYAARIDPSDTATYYCRVLPDNVVRFRRPQTVPDGIGAVIPAGTAVVAERMRALRIDGAARLQYSPANPSGSGLWVTENPRSSQPLWTNKLPTVVAFASPADALDLPAQAPNEAWALAMGGSAGPTLLRTSNIAPAEPAWERIAYPLLYGPAYPFPYPPYPFPYRFGGSSPAYFPQAIGVSPLVQGLVLLGLADGTALRSVDGGRTWSSVSFGKFSDIRGFAFHPTRSNVVLAVGNDIFLSDDAGRSWGRLQVNDARYLMATEAAWRDSQTAIVGTTDQGAIVVSIAPLASEVSINYTSLWWNPNESGWGINLNHQGNIIFATLFTYDAAGSPLWLLMSNGSRQPDGRTFLGDLYQTTGPPFDAHPFAPIGPANVAKVGTMSLAFADADSGTLAYSYNGKSVTKAIRKQVFGPAAALCQSVPGTTRTALTNYQDLWWNPSESGWGLNIAHQGDLLFAALFSYDAAGKGLWLVMTRGERQADGSYLGDLFRTTGPAFDANPFTPIGSANVTKVGTMRLSFTDGQTGWLSYSVGSSSVTKWIIRQVFATPVPACR
jgi:photosystem II stability/assembly factor-like uncharacterized protein